MSVKHPIIAVTGSSGAGTTTTTTAFSHIFRQLGINAAFVEGDSFHHYTRAEMEVMIRKAKAENRNISYFGAEANDFARLEKCFTDYSNSGIGETRAYLHTFDEAVPYNQMPGTFTQWQPLPDNTDMLYYEGLHGGVVTPEHNVAQHVDLLIGMVPIVNLEWIQKIIRDTSERGHTQEKVMSSIVRSMDDYINHITPQFSRTHINFQRVPTVDTSNPFSAKDIPSLDESFVVIRFRGMENVDFPYYLRMIQGSFMSRVNTLVVPGGKMSLAMELILTPLIRALMERRQACLAMEALEQQGQNKPQQPDPN
ncbi:phosphoribulokinase [Shewanella sp.]|uniref:phosphoribulokinase n=1 Tax=Shewanella sp. TaxID=50422 RepID=UPI003A985C99